MKKFVMYATRAVINDLRKRTPWLLLPISFSELGFESVLYCSDYEIDNKFLLEIHQTNHASYRSIGSILEPIFSFSKLYRQEPDLVVVAPLGSYLLTVIPLILFFKFVEKALRKTKTSYILKTDWSVDYTGSNFIKRVASKFICSISTYVFDRVTVETYCGKSKLEMMPLARKTAVKRVPLGYPEKFQRLNKYDNAKRENIILCVARVTPMKGQDVLIRAFSIIIKKHPDWLLHLVGPVNDIEYKTKLDNLILELKLFDKVLFFDFSSEKFLYDEYGKSSIFCLPSIYLENAGNVKYEAIAAGIPVITSDVPCELDSRELGFLVAPAGNIEKLSKHLETLIESPAKRAEMVQYSQTKVLSYKDVATIYRDL
jgi:glycosyltransferase involved in cell wall biosynthesis